MLRAVVHDYGLGYPHPRQTAAPGARLDAGWRATLCALP